MTVIEFSTKIANFNQGLENVLSLIKQEAPLLYTSAMAEEHNQLNNEQQRNSLGLIRAIFLGESSTGKSTMINSICGKVVVPEVAHTSTMIPTWIGYTDDFAEEGVKVSYYPSRKDNNGNEIVDEISKSKVESIDDFRCFYCFKAEDAADPERRSVDPRFESMKLSEAYMRLLRKDGLMSKFAMTLVDTLGNGATLADDFKAQHNMSDVDMAFVLLDEKGTVSKGTRDFLASTLFKSPINPEHIVFVINKIDRSQSKADSIRNCRESIKGILHVAYGDNMPAGLVEKLFSQIVPYSSLFNRIVTAGKYPFRADTQKINAISDADFENPQDANQQEIVQISNEKTESENRLRRKNTDDELLEDGFSEELDKVLTAVVNDMFRDGTIVNNHLQKIEVLARNFNVCVSERLAAFNNSIESVTSKIDRFSTVRNQLTMKEDKFIDDTQDIINSFPDDINTYLRNNVIQIQTIYGNKANPIVESIDISTKTRSKYSTARELRNLSEADMQQIFVPEYNSYKDKLVALICDVICDNIFRPANDKEKVETPYHRFNKKTQQSINNYIAEYINDIKSINDGNEFDIITVDGAIFQKYADDRMNYLVLRLIEKVKSNIDRIIDDSLASELNSSIHNFRAAWHTFFHKNDVDFLYAKMNESARKSIQIAISGQIQRDIVQEPGFIKSAFSNEIKNTLYKIIPYTTKKMSGYLNKVDVELLQLQNNRTEYENRRSFYENFAEKSVSEPLLQMLNDIDAAKQEAFNGITF